MRTWKAALAGGALLVAVAACDGPFTLPSTRALEAGASASLAAGTLEVKGTYTEAGRPWTVDVQLVRPISEHVTVKSGAVDLEAIVVGSDAFFRGSAFLAQHLGHDPASLNLLKAAGHAWWKGSAGDVPRLHDLTDPAPFTSAFLGPNVERRADHVMVDGVETVDLSGPRADVYVAEAPPYQLVRVKLATGVTIDGMAAGDLRYGGFDAPIRISPPPDVIDFSDLSTLPPNYTVVAVDTSACGTPCVVSAQLRNLGGTKGAVAPSSVRFTMTETASSGALGTCQATVQPDVGYNATTTVSCTINGLSGQGYNAATVTATPINPGGA